MNSWSMKSTNQRRWNAFGIACLGKEKTGISMMAKETAVTATANSKEEALTTIVTETAVTAVAVITTRSGCTVSPICTIAL